MLNMWYISISQICYIAEYTKYFKNIIVERNKMRTFATEYKTNDYGENNFYYQ